MKLVKSGGFPYDNGKGGILMKIKNRKAAWIFAGIAAGLVVAAAGLYSLSASIYDGTFNLRCTTSQRDTFEIAEFREMTRQRHTFRSNRGQTLVGYLYENPEVQKKAVVVFAHGFGAGGQRGYMDLFDYLAKRGYCVFAYDATGNDESEGEVIGGLPQGIIDLDYAIDYAYTLEEISGLPFVLMGYSWGALSVGNVLNYHPEVKAVATLAGCNQTLDLIEYHGRQKVGAAVKLLMPFARLHEFFRYGKYAFSTAMKGFANSDCTVLVLHGAKDDTVPMEYGYDLYMKKYGDDPRFTFVKYENYDHGLPHNAYHLLNTDVMEAVVEFFDNSLA